MKHLPVPVTLLTGYLGSGKTTLLNHILSNQKGLKFAVVVNDIGEVNIDEKLIERGGIVSGKDDSLVPLQNGCICCTLKEDLVRQLSDLAQSGRFDYIVIEASGVCEPYPIAQTICSMADVAKKYGMPQVVRLDSIVSVVDALRMVDEFGCGDSLVKKDIDEEDIENLVIQQIEFCDVILLNKASEVDAGQLKKLKAVIRTIQPRAEIIETDYANVDVESIVNSHRFNFEKTAFSSGWVAEMDKPASDLDDDDDHDDHDHDHHDGHSHEHHHHHEDESEVEEYGIGTFVYFRRLPLNKNKFISWLSKEWPHSIIRTKGVVYFSSEPNMSYMFEQAGKQKNLTESGLWIASAPEDERRQMVEENPDMKRDWKEPYGDRMLKVVFIGQHLDKERISAELDACLVSDFQFK